MRSQWPKLEKVGHLLKGQYICFFQCFKSFTTCLENKNTVFIDNHNTSRLVDQFKSLYISILSQDALNEIGKPHSEWRYPRNIRNKCQKDKYVSKKQKQLLTVRLQNLHITEYKGPKRSIWSFDGSPCCSLSKIGAVYGCSSQGTVSMTISILFCSVEMMMRKRRWKLNFQLRTLSDCKISILKCDSRS